MAAKPSRPQNRLLFQYLPGSNGTYPLRNGVPWPPAPAGNSQFPQVQLSGWQIVLVQIFHFHRVVENRKKNTVFIRGIIDFFPASVKRKVSRSI